MPYINSRRQLEIIVCGFCKFSGLDEAIFLVLYFIRKEQKTLNMRIMLKRVIIMQFLFQKVCFCYTINAVVTEEALGRALTKK